jgi:hypothetical protein
LEETGKPDLDTRQEMPVGRFFVCGFRFEKEEIDEDKGTIS